MTAETQVDPVTNSDHHSTESAVSPEIPGSSPNKATEGDPDDVDKLTLLQWVQKFEEKEALQRLMEEAKCDEALVEQMKTQEKRWKSIINAPVDEKRSTPLHVAVRKEFLKTTEWLLDKGAFVNAVDDERKQPLHIACGTTASWSQKHLDLISVLATRVKALKKLAGVDSEGMNPLHLAVRHGLRDEATLKVLMDVTDICEREYRYGRTPLNIAATWNDQTVVSLLLEEEHVSSDSSCMCTIPDNDGWTPLISAMRYQDFSISMVLIDHMLGHLDSDTIAAQDDEGRSALMWLCFATPRDEESKIVLRILASRLISAVENHISDTDKKGYTALHIAMMMLADKKLEDDTIAKTILKSMPIKDLLRRNNSGETAFDCAFDDGVVEKLKPLLKAMASRITQRNDHLRHDYFSWLARRKDRHAFAKEVLLELPAEGEAWKVERSSDWTLVQWAIYHQLPGILLSLPELRTGSVNSSVDSENPIQQGKTLIKALKDGTSLLVGQDVDKKERRGQSNAEYSALLSNMEDVLDFLDAERSENTKRSREPKKISTPNAKMEASLNRFYAAIIEMRPDDRNFSNTCKFRSIQDVVYAPGKIKTIRDAVRDAQKLAAVSDENNERGDKGNTFERNFVWIHLPSSNMIWMMLDCGDEEFERVTSFLRTSGIETPDQSSPSRFMRPRYVKSESRNMSLERREKGKDKIQVDRDDEQRSPAGVQDQEKSFTASALYMPFLSLSCDPQEEKRRSVTAGSRSPVAISSGSSEAEGRSPRQVLFDAYKGFIHGSPTLDEYYHHFTEDPESMADQAMRNRDQVVMKHWQKQVRLKDEEITTWPLLRVGQLWIWTIGEKWMITSTSCAHTDEENHFVLDFLRHLKGLTGGGIGQEPASSLELSKALVDFCIGAYHRQGTSHSSGNTRNQPAHLEVNEPEAPRSHSANICSDTLAENRSIRQKFSDYINGIGRDEARLFAEFSVRNGQHNSLSSEASYVRISNVLRDATWKAAKLLQNVKDARDELNILRTVVEFQQNVQLKMHNVEKKFSSEFDSWGLQSTDVLKDITELDRIAQRTYEAVNTTITLHESEIANLQSGLANKQAKETGRQGTIVLVFTIATLYFLPLSFLSSLFALDVESFLKTPVWSYWVMSII
ncbi:hypothetical protein CSIM01_07374 [Colletotrichum simmondsii]|uniref:Uncharacterized protein n=1 Tax=Colletotrichum simmondsii TaxID=703756 RepID=A0A135TPM6_9PEZI|nr:hypothetical protein CSIM01_07374 [Colletotrichum simmondsii]